jgi:hypothetical protein
VSIKVGDRVRIAKLDNWLPIEDPSQWLGKEGTVTKIATYIEVDILLDGDNTLWWEEELEKI